MEEYEANQQKKIKSYVKRNIIEVQGLPEDRTKRKENKTTVITALAIPVIQYTFGIIKWTIAEMRKLDRQARKLLTMYGALH